MRQSARPDLSSWASNNASLAAVNWQSGMNALLYMCRKLGLALGLIWGELLGIEEVIQGGII
jgi:hypothetical protein